MGSGLTIQREECGEGRALLEAELAQKIAVLDDVTRNGAPLQIEAPHGGFGFLQGDFVENGAFANLSDAIDWLSEKSGIVRSEISASFDAARSGRVGQQARP